MMLTRDALIEFLQKHYAADQPIDLQQLAGHISVDDMRERAALRFDTMEDYNAFIDRQGPLTGNYSPRIYIGGRQVTEI